MLKILISLVLRHFYWPNLWNNTRKLHSIPNLILFRFARKIWIPFGYFLNFLYLLKIKSGHSGLKIRQVYFSWNLISKNGSRDLRGRFSECYEGKNTRVTSFSTNFTRSTSSSGGICIKTGHVWAARLSDLVRFWCEFTSKVKVRFTVKKS